MLEEGGAVTRVSEGDGRKIAFYVRISTDEDHQKYSLRAQRAQLEAYCTRQYEEPCAITKVYSDEDSGARIDRPGLQEMLRDACTGAFDALLVFRVDRVSRKIRDLAAIIDYLDEHGVIFKSISEPFDTSHAAGKMMLQMLGIFAEFERESLMQRAMVCREKMVKEGRLPTPRPPYGYTLGPGKLLVPEPGETRILRRIFELYTCKWLNSGEIACTLNAEGAKKRGGSLWESSAVLNALKNPACVGKLKWSGVVHDTGHESIIEGEVFEAAQQLLRARSASGIHRLRSEDHLLLGVAYCGCCGSHMGGFRQGRRHYYICAARRSGQECSQSTVRAEPLDAALLADLHATYGNTTLMQKIWRAAGAILKAERREIEKEVRKLSGEVEQISAAIGKYHAGAGSGDLRPDLFGDRLEELATRRRGIDERLCSLRTVLDHPRMPEHDPEALAECVRLLGQIIERGGQNERRLALEVFLDRVVLRQKDAVDVRYRLPMPRPLRELAGKGARLYRVARLVRQAQPRICFTAKYGNGSESEAAPQIVEVRTSPTPLFEFGKVRELSMPVRGDSALCELLRRSKEVAANGRNRKMPDDLVLKHLYRRPTTRKRSLLRGTRRPDARGAGGGG